MTTTHPDHRHPDHTVVIAAGGLNSTVLAYWLAARHSRLTLISFTHEQRHRIERDRAAGIARLLDATHQNIDLTSLNGRFTGSSAQTLDNCRSDKSTAAALVPDRTAIMLYLAAATAITARADAIAFGAHAENHTTRPDCRPAVVERFARHMQTTNKSLRAPGFQVLAPFLSLTTSDIVRVGQTLAVPFARTWSCRQSQQLHCGTCHGCTERREALHQNGITDSTEYQTA